jgi:small subunit ribosomal protein S7
MSRRRRVHKKIERLDSNYASPVVAQLISTVMKSGKKSLAERIVYGAIEKSRENSDAVDPLEILHKAIDNVKPRLEVKSRRVGGATYQVPIEVAPERQISLAMRWLVGYASSRRGIGLSDALANEIKDAAAGQGNAIKKRDDTHRMAQANRAFAHFRY